MRHLRLLCALMTTLLLITACSKHRAENEIYVGTIAGPETELMEVAKKVAAKQYKLKIIIVEFNDYSLPNQALADGSIDANMFQHQPYLDATVKAKNYPIMTIGKMFIYPMAVYSSKWKDLNQLSDKAIVALPNDPSNETRALLLLQQGGLIKLKPHTAEILSLQDVAKNPKHLQFKELDAAQLPRILPDVDIAVINTNFALLAGLNPKDNGLLKEAASSPYANIIAVRSSEKNAAKFQHLLDALHSPAVLEKAEQLFKGQAIPAWGNGANHDK
jgi:D-methionine transport system substrate-binding protein